MNKETIKEIEQNTKQEHVEEDRDLSLQYVEREEQ